MLSAATTLRVGRGMVTSGLAENDGRSDAGDGAEREDPEPWRDAARARARAARGARRRRRRHRTRRGGWLLPRGGRPSVDRLLVQGDHPDDEGARAVGVRT